MDEQPSAHRPRLRPKVTAILGPTASGKTRAAIAVARDLGGVVVSADSRHAYRGMDVATAKERRAYTLALDGRGDVPARVHDGVPQIGLDLADPRERFTAAR